MIWPLDLSGILRAIIATEGGFVNDPHDAGGATNMGVTQNALASFRGHEVTVDDVRNLSASEAEAIYRQRYISAPGFDGLTDLRLLYIVADTAVLFGPDRAARFLQAAIGVPVDGKCGPGTASKANDIAATQPAINAIAISRIMAHCQRCEMDPSQLRFLVGWVRRASAFIETTNGVTS